MNRSNIKALKAKFEENAEVDCNYYESRNKEITSYIAPGGLISFKFTTLDPGNKNAILRTEQSIIIPSRQTRKIYDTQIQLYNKLKLYDGEYLNYYDIAYDKPETHLIKKDNKYYYSFFSTYWKDEVELRGLKKKKYIVRDYLHNIELGTVKGPTDNVKIGFKNFLILEVTPK